MLCQSKNAQKEKQNSLVSVLRLLVLAIIALGSSPSMSEDALIVTYGSDYKPFAWGEANEPFGIQKDFVEELLGKRMGLKLKHEAYPWKRCQEYVKRGTKDAFFTVPTPERAQYTYASKIPFYNTHFVIHTSVNNPHISRLKEVRTLTDLEAMPDLAHIHMLGSGWHENALQKMRKVYQIRDASTIPLMLKNLRADLYIEQREMVRYQVKALGIVDEIATLDEPVIRTLGWHLFIGKNSPHAAMMSDINRKLEELKENGELEEIKNALFVKYGVE